MKRVVRYLFVSILALSAVAQSSCTKQDGGRNTEILFNVKSLGGEMDVVTKASVVSTENLTEFYAAATTGIAGSEASEWTSFHFSGVSGGTFRADEPRKWWPLTDPEYHFYASNLPLTFAAAGTTVSASTATDVVCAYLPVPTFCEPNVLVFDHVFARVGSFTVNAAEGYTISGVTVYITPKVSGTYNLRTGAGQSDGTGWSGTADGSAVNIAGSFSTIVYGTENASSASANDLYLVPGNYTLTATWTATRGDYTETFSSKEVSVSITGGKVNAISTTLGGLAEEIVFSVVVTPWGSVNVPAVFPTT